MADVTLAASEPTDREIRDRLRSNDWPALLGVAESQHVDFKGAPFLLDEKREQYELAKDVSAFANAQGGILVLGIETIVEEAHTTERASALNPFPLARMDVKRYQDLLRELVYPEIDGLDVQRVLSDADPSKALGYVFVPPQQDQPFLVARVAIDETRPTLSGMLAGYFVRRGTNAMGVTKERLHSLLRDGLRFDTSIRERLDRLEGQLERYTSAVQVPKELHPAVLTLPNHIGDVVAAMDLSDRPVFVLAAIPEHEHDFLALIERPESPGSRLIEHPPSLRQRGFDLEAGGPARLIEGQIRQAEGYGRKTLELSRDGTILFVAAADEDFLGWGRRLEKARVRINPLALIEVTYLFCLLVQEIYRAAAIPDESISFTIELRHAFDDAGPVTLAEGPLNSIAHTVPGYRHAASASDFERSVIATASSDPRVTAYRLVKELYLWFGIDDPAGIPYVESETSGFSLDAIRQAGQ